MKELTDRTLVKMLCDAAQRIASGNYDQKSFTAYRNEVIRRLEERAKMILHLEKQEVQKEVTMEELPSMQDRPAKTKRAKAYRSRASKKSDE